MTVGRPYWVRWVDAQMAWDESTEDIGSVCQCMGWVVEVTAAGVRLAFEVGDSGLDDGSRFLFDIPAGCILEYRELED